MNGSGFVKGEMREQALGSTDIEVYPMEQGTEHLKRTLMGAPFYQGLVRLVISY